MTIPFFKNLYKIFAFSPWSSPLRGMTRFGITILCITLFSIPVFPAFAGTGKAKDETKTLQGRYLSAEQELKACKPALLAQLNEKRRLTATGCPIGQKLILWLGILRKPDQFTATELIRFLDSHSHWPYYDKLCEKSEPVIKEKASAKEILTWFEKNPPKTPEAAITYANTLLAHKEKKKAEAVIVKAWQTMDMTKTEEKKFLAQCDRFLSSKNHIARLRFLLWNENSDDAKRLLARVPAETRKAAEIRLALLQGKSPQSVPSLKEEGVLYETVKWYKKQKNWAEAAKILLHTPPSKEYAENWWKLRSYVAREYIALKDYQKAYQILKKHNLEAGSESFADAEWLSGWLALRFLKNPLVAQHHFETFSKNVKSAISKARAFYWLGRTHEAKKDLALAKKWYQKAAQYKTTYYGQLGALKLGEKPYPILHASPQVTAEEKKRFNQKDLVIAAHMLKGLGKGAAHELSKFLSPIATQAKTKGERELAVHLAHHLSPCDVVWVAKRAGSREPVLLKAAYPVCSLPKRPGLPESALLLAIAYKESHFNAGAQSHKGATGLLQLMPKAAADAAKRLGVPHTEQKLFDPRHNLLLGSDHVSSLLNDFSHSYLLVTAAYNAGPTPVGRWLKNFGDPHIDPIDWIELIPYSETRNYVQRVLENVTNYRSHLHGVPKKTLHDDFKRRI